jgi:predicted RNA-binding protein with PUA-like domain
MATGKRRNASASRSPATKSSARTGARGAAAKGTGAGARRAAATRGAPAATPRPRKPATRKGASDTSPRSAASPPHEGGRWAAWFTRAPGERRYWLVKSEPDVFSFDDLEKAPGRTTAWDGVRNFAARNFLRDGMKLGDGVLFYYSSINPQVVVGTCEVVREGYPDATANNPKHHGYDGSSDPASPSWYVVDLNAVRRFPRPVPLPEIKQRAELAGMALLRIGRLSVTPVTADEWRVITAMGGG